MAFNAMLSKLMNLQIANTPANFPVEKSPSVMPLRGISAAAICHISNDAMNTAQT